MDNIYPGEKGRRDFCFEHGTLLFRTRAERLFSFAVLHPACLSRPFPSLSSLVRFRGCFSLGGINGGEAHDDPYNRTPMLRESREREDNSRSEKLEETHKHLSRRWKQRASAVGCHFHRGKITSLARSPTGGLSSR